MIAQEVLDAFLEEAARDPVLQGVASLVGAGGPGGLMGVIAALPQLLPRLQTPEQKLELLDHMAGAYLRVRHTNGAGVDG